jgi:hypothetical protein
VAFLALCPFCQKEVQSSFGMVLCENCHAPLFFDFDGNLQIGDSVSESSDPYAEPIVENTNGYKEEFASEPSDPLEPVSVQDHSEISQEILDYSNKSSNDEIEAVAAEEFNFDLPLGGQLQENNSPSTPTDDANNAPFDLMDEISASNSLLLYDIEIEGIDGSKIRSELYEELKDPRWGWAAIEIMNSVSSGILILKDIDAVKASLLINRLKALPIEIKWKQNI